MEVALLFGIIVALLLVGVPIAVALGLSSITFLLVLSDTSLASIAQSFFQAMAGHYTLLAIPFFILASTFMSTGGVAKRIIRFSIALVGHFRGGLAIAGVFACMMFAALSGSSPATVVAIGSIVIAGMRQVGYTKDFAAGVIANAGTLGILIPPSIVMVVYASATDVSVGRMFLAGVIPGLMAGTMLMLAIWVIARMRNLPKGEWKGWGEILSSGRDAIWGLFLIIIILGGIYGGIFTPTEAAAVAAVYAFLIANFVYRDMGIFAKVAPKGGNFATIFVLGGVAWGIAIWLMFWCRIAICHPLWFRCGTSPCHYGKPSQRQHACACAYRL
jgi:C4-dicarboxylate transporter DctM subunit